MDELDRNLQHSVSLNGRTYIFRRPTVRQQIAAENLAADLRGNRPVGSVFSVLGLTDMVASLNTFVVDPRGFDFGSMHEEDLVAIYTEVAQWLETFRSPVAGEARDMGDGGGAER